MVAPGRMPSPGAGASPNFRAHILGRTWISPVEVTTDRYRVYLRELDELLPAAFMTHRCLPTTRLRSTTDAARLRPMRGLSETVPPGS